MCDIEIRPVEESEFAAFVVAFHEGFSDDIPDESLVERERRLFPLDRTLAAFDGTSVVGTFGGLELMLTVPGGRVAMEGTTIVTVFPTHRRMGLLRRMMSEHLEVAATRGDPVAGLWASESDIYGRFGYGIATRSRSLTLDGPRIEFRDDTTIERVRRVPAENAQDELSALYESVARRTPGMLSRDDIFWRDHVLPDDDQIRRGMTARRYVVHDGDDGVDGYATYRQKSGETDDGHPDGSVSVIEVIADGPVARASLWSYLTRIDGCPKVRVWNAPLNDPVPMMVREPRRLIYSSVYDALWIRILDVEAALGARHYERDGSLTFAVVDEFRTQTVGTYRIDVADGVSMCSRTDSSPEISIDIDVLGALYLGGGDAYGYADAGRISGSPASVRSLHRLFRTDREPWCNSVF
ncbi:MAG: GNAT family N-acetyltransferase [Acidimicrobiia bacterium]